MKKIFLLLAFMIATVSRAKADTADWLNQSLIRKALAVSELSHHIDGTMTDIKSAVTYKNWSAEFGSTVYRVELEYKLGWSGGGMSLLDNDYLVLLKSDGYTEIYSDRTYFLKELAAKKFDTFEARKKFSLDTFSDGMMSAQLGQFLPMAQSKAEAYVAKKTSLPVISGQTLTTGLSSQSLSGHNLLYRFEVVTSPSGKIVRQNIIVVVHAENSEVEIFEEDPKYNSQN